MGTMTTFELNKIAGAILFAGLIAMIASIVSKGIFEPHHSGDEHTWHAASHYPIVSESLKNKQVILDETPNNNNSEVLFSELLSRANPVSGKKIFKKCSACHSVTEGGPNKVGPNIWNIVGKKVASNDGFGYSEAMIELGGVWDIDSLESFISDPKGYLPGTKMSFSGIKKSGKRSDLVKYLISISEK